MTRICPRALLSEKEAIEIYQYRKAAANSSAMRDARLHGKSSAVGKKYNISPKAVRDIWNRRTWTQETRHLWSEDEKPMERINFYRRLPRSSSNSSCSSSNLDGKWNPNSLEWIVLGSKAWAFYSASESYSVYTTDTDPISHIYMQAAYESTAWQQSNLADRCVSPTSSQPSLGADNWQNAPTITENATWEAEWGDGPLAGGVSDPFFADWTNLAIT